MHPMGHYGDAGQLSWLRRINIAIGVARRLRYLHTEVQPPFTISELNSNAIYLTEDFSPKLVDFERWNTIVSRSDNGLGYLSNGSLFNGFLEASEETWNMDVQGNTYAFGVLLVELISGRSPNYKDRGSIVDWALDYLRDPNKMIKLVDPEIKNVKIENLSVLGSVISLCTDPEPSKRPSMEILCAMLEDGIDTSVGAIFRDCSLAWSDLVLVEIHVPNSSCKNRFFKRGLHIAYKFVQDLVHRQCGTILNTLPHVQASNISGPCHGVSSVGPSICPMAGSDTM